MAVTGTKIKDLPGGVERIGAEYLAFGGTTTKKLEASRVLVLRFPTVASLLADDGMALTAGDPVAAEGFLYEAAAAEAEDAHVTTAGGQKLYVLPTPGYDVRAFGAVNSADSGDYQAELQAAFSAAEDTEIPVIVPAGTYRSSAAISAEGCRRIRMDGELYFYNETDGLTIGRTSSVTADMARADIAVRVRGEVDVEGITGVICRGMWRSRVVAHVDGFEVGFEHRMESGNNEYCAGCRFGLTLRDSRVKLRFDQSSFCSSNQYYWLVAVKQNETLEPTIGVEWASNTGPSNNNSFYGAWLEDNDTPILFRAPAASNIFHDARLEGAGPVLFEEGTATTGASSNIVYADIVSDELSFFSEYDGASPYPNFVDSRVYGGIRPEIVSITWRDWIHRTATAGRHYFCPKLACSTAGESSYGPDYFDWASVDAAARSFTIADNDEGSFDVPVRAGDQFILSIQHNLASVASNAAIMRLEALDESKDALTMIESDEAPYLGTSRNIRSTGTTNTGNTMTVQNDRAGLYSGIRVNRAEVKWLRVVLLPGVEFYRVALFGVYDRNSRPSPPEWRQHLDIKPIDGLDEVPDFTGQFGFVRGGNYAVFGADGEWMTLGFKRGRVTLSSGTTAVSLGYTAPSTAYHVLVSGYANETYWVSDKTTSGFNINSSNGASAAQVEYILVPGGS